MKKLLPLLGLLCSLSPLTLKAQTELSCPAGMHPFPNHTTYDVFTQKYRNWLCYDDAGNVNIGASSGSTGGVYSATSYGLICDGVTNDTAALSALVTLIGAQQASIVYPLGKTCLIGNITTPTNISMDYSPGASWKIVTGTIANIQGGVNNPDTHQIFFNTGPSLGTIDFTNNTGVTMVYPEWFGASVNNTGSNASINSNAIQAAIWASFGCGPLTCRVNSGAGQKWNKQLYLSTIFHINQEMQLWKIHGFVINCSGMDTGGIWQDGVNLRALDLQHVTYGNISNCLFSTNGSNDATHPIFTISASLGGDANSQFVTFNNINFGCSVGDQIGGIISPNGEGNGNNIDFYNVKVNNCPTGLAIGSGSAQACNALNNLFDSGDISGSTLYGLYANCGSWIVRSSTFENGLLTQTGFDMICTHSLTFQPCTMDNVRSESLHLASGGRLVIQHSATIFQGSAWDVGNLAGTSGTLNQLVTGSGSGGDGLYYAVTVAGTWGGLNNTLATSGTATTIVCGGCSFTVNGFTGMRVSIVSGTGGGSYGIVSSNTSTTITVPSWIETVAPQVGQFNGFTPPDSTSHFVVEPNWGTQTTSGTVTFAAVAGTVITGDGGASSPCSNCFISDNQLIGLPILSQGSVVTNNIFSTPFWYGNPTAGYFNTTLNPSYATGNIVSLPCQGCAPGYQNAGVLYKMNTSPGAISGAILDAMGGHIFTWSCSNARGGGIPCGESGIGGVSDPNRQNTSGKVILEMYGIAGRPVPYLKTNTIGTDMDIGGGQSTGNANGGALNIWNSTIGVSGTQSNPLQKTWRFSSAFNFEALLSKGQHYNTQAAQADSWGVATCAANTVTVVFTTAYTSTPAIVVSDETAAGGARVSAKSNSQFTITCSGATDVVDYFTGGNPN